MHAKTCLRDDRAERFLALMFVRFGLVVPARVFVSGSVTVDVDESVVVSHLASAN